MLRNDQEVREFEEIIADMIVFEAKMGIKEELNKKSSKTYLKRCYENRSGPGVIDIGWFDHKEDDFETFINNYNTHFVLLHYLEPDELYYSDLFKKSDYFNYIGRPDLRERWKNESDHIEYSPNYPVLNYQRIRTLATQKIMQLGVKKAKVYFDYKKMVNIVYKTTLGIFKKETNRYYQNVFIIAFEVYW